MGGWIDGLITQKEVIYTLVAMETLDHAFMGY